MTQISVSKRTPETYDVELQDADGSVTTHTVTVRAADVARFGAGYDTAALVAASFRFLIDREPKEAILSRFDLPVIAQYFPDYPSRIGDYLTA